ncbi:MAG: class I SAM-dependent methyltransferase [Pseudomonadota bacterium]
MAFDADWPAVDLEAVQACPYCGGTDRSLAYEGVQDWAFGCAPGRWSYWNCGNCQALYLHPRPTSASIGNAYARYYTHGGDQAVSRLAAFKQRLRNAHWSNRFQTSITPRLGLPRWATDWLKPWIAEPFGLRQWAQLPKGLLLDVGCGNGDKLKLAGQMGWQARGIELDASAVQAAQAQGLQIEQGGYELLARYQGQADCVVCSHVLEHVHQPLEMLGLLLASLKPQGVLLLSVPNAASFLRHHYGESWRGLEAPRHLAIPDGNWLADYLRAQGFDCTQVPSYPLETAMESERIRRRGADLLASDQQAAKRLLRSLPEPVMAQQDVTQLVCVRALA